jgi:hypothetical protein
MSQRAKPRQSTPKLSKRNFEALIWEATADANDDDEIFAECLRGRESLELAILDVPLPSPPPRGAEWIEAYRFWRRR